MKKINLIIAALVTAFVVSSCCSSAPSPAPCAPTYKSPAK